MGNNSSVKQKHYKSQLVENCRALGHIDGKKLGPGGTPIPHPNDKPPERLDWSKVK